MEEQKSKQRQNGITLIALVVTIIVLIILAGVSINMLVEENGIITQAQTAKEENGRTEIIEKIQLEIADKQAENLGTISKEEVENIAKNYGDISHNILITTRNSYEIPMVDIWSEWEKIVRESANLVDVSTLQYGIRVVNGVASENPSFVSTDKIAIEPATTYISSRNIQNINYYNSDGEFISHVNGVGGSTLSTGWTVPDNAEYMIVCFTYNSSWEQESFEKGMWIAEYNKNKILYEKFGTVNFDDNIPSNFDTNKIFNDTYYNTSGGILSCVNEYNFTLLELKLNNSFSVSGLSNITLYYFDENFTLLGEDSNMTNTHQYYMANTVKYPNIKYIGIQWQNAWLTGEELNIIYNNNEKNLLGKKLVAYGDSITYNFSWARATADYFGMYGYNRGIGGTTVNETGSIAWVDMEGMYLSRPGNGSEPEGTEGVDYKTIASSMCNDERIATIPSDADIVMFFGGTNGMDEESYRITLDKIHMQAPNAKIICINLPYRQDENSIDNFSERRSIITKVANEYNYPVIQLYDLMGVDEDNASIYMADNVHWNTEGNKLIAKNVIETIKECVKNNYL